LRVYSLCVQIWKHESCWLVVSWSHPWIWGHRRSGGCIGCLAKLGREGAKFPGSNPSFWTHSLTHVSKGR
jgi:hypothetical protein